MLAIEKIEAERAKVRQVANLKQGAGTPVKVLIPQRGEEGQARDKAAAQVGVSPSYVQIAKATQAKPAERANVRLRATQAKPGEKVGKVWALMPTPIDDPGLARDKAAVQVGGRSRT